MPAALEVRALTKRLYAGMPGCAASALVLSDVWLRVAAGERVAICGADDAARTTLLLVAAGLARPDAGSVQVAIGGAAYVPMEPPPLGGLTVLELLEWHRRSLIARGSADAAVREPLAALRVVGCEALADVRTRLLSPSSARRVAVARALVGRPALLAVDAPRPGQLPNEWREMDGTLARLAAEGTAVLFGAPAGAALGPDVRAFWLRSAAAARTTIATRKVRRGDGAPPAARRAVAEPAPLGP